MTKRSAVAANKVLNVELTCIPATAARVCPASGELIAVSDEGIRLNVMPDCGIKLPCKRFF